MRMTGEDALPQGSHNTPEYTVSGLGAALRQKVESAFPHVRVRGEISGFKAASSGHLYLSLRDEGASLDAVCWRGQAARLGVQPEDGLEVIATGRLTTYPGRSRYQLVIDAPDPAGEGALLKLLEARRRKLAEEGLFDAARKRPLPAMPQVIGVITSPTGAVIRDILHRLADRFPCRVLLWPVLVQGDRAAAQIGAAIAGFAALDPAGPLPRPDLLIIARGGGSLEDLWAFNDEQLVRAVAACTIPVISAVGHETDTSLIDLAADLRAPTPTAAAEMAVPVRAELLAMLQDLARRGLAGATRLLATHDRHLRALGGGLPRPESLLQNAAQRLDDLGERFANAGRTLLRDAGRRLDGVSARLRQPEQTLGRAEERLAGLDGRLKLAVRQAWRQDARRFQAARHAARLEQAMTGLAGRHDSALTQLWARLQNVSHENVLRRGFAIVHDSARKGGIIADLGQARPGATVILQFRDGTMPARLGDTGAGVTPAGNSVGKQGRLL